MKPMITLAIAALALASCRKNKPAPAASPPVTKEIIFTVSAVNDYSSGTSSPYGYRAASVKLTLEKFTKNAPGVQKLWDTTFAYRPLSGFPRSPQQYRVQKSIAIAEQNEQLHVSYEVLYGSLYNEPQRYGYGTLLLPGQNSLHVNVAL